MGEFFRWEAIDWSISSVGLGVLRMIMSGRFCRASCRFEKILTLFGRVICLRFFWRVDA